MEEEFFDSSFDEVDGRSGSPFFQRLSSFRRSFGAGGEGATDGSSFQALTFMKSARRGEAILATETFKNSLWFRIGKLLRKNI